MQDQTTCAALMAEREFVPFRRNDPLMNFVGEIGISTTVTPLVLQLLCGTNAENPQGILHGGALSAVCDVGMYEAARHAFGADCVTVTQEMKFLRQGHTGSPMFIVSEILKLGHRTAFCNAKVLQGDDLIAYSTGQFTKLRTISTWG
ncbi:PaaI family thioesterase [Paracoccus onubensis]|uniref:PaaI family thioesterase n=1 Tax=Paracoccus onubensis TaxID=1675788 RepID=A0A418SXZ1_9RHOB|nr:PaaI family thioesterase [Paracoccus onubensis]RJE85842.1 PaaI family thioesterase [Paracoccus onubensis]